MEELSNGEIVLSGNYIKSSKIKQCNNCNCLSPIKTKTCCWCGSNDLKTLIGNEEVEKEQEKLKEAQNQDSRIIIIGVLLIIAGFLLGFSGATTFGMILIVVGGMLIAMVEADKTNGHPDLAVKYSNINEFLSYISKKLSLQRSFTKDSEDKEHIAIKSKLNNDFDTQISKPQFISLLDIWFEAYISPEVIKTRVNKYLKENNYKNYSKIINSITKDYYEENKKVDSQICVGLAQTFKTESEQRLNIQTPGLDYGIITSSVGNAMLYSAMNNIEKKNQYNRQLTPILRNTNRNLNYLFTSYSNSIETNYNNYKKQIRKYVAEKVNE